MVAGMFTPKDVHREAGEPPALPEDPKEK